MRDIKFRGKSFGNGEFVFGDLTRYSEEMSYIIVDLIEGEFYQVDSKTVGQFTGLKDKNGKEIYEGDVLRYTKVGGHSSRGIVKYVTEFARWEYWHTQQKQGFPVLSDHDNMEVIGNIHENPELLEIHHED